jgi:hypothetical protein
MLQTNLPLLEPQEIRVLNCDQELQRTLINLRRDVVIAARRIELPTLLALARSRFSGENDHEAVERLGQEARAILDALAQHGAAVRTQAQAEKDRLAPLVSEAGHQDIELQRKIEKVDRGLHVVGGEVVTQREALRKAGVSPEEIERLIAQDVKAREARRSELITERNALALQQLALEEFLKTRDEGFLPEGFKVREPIRVGT